MPQGYRAPQAQQAPLVPQELIPRYLGLQEPLVPQVQEPQEPQVLLPQYQAPQVSQVLPGLGQQELLALEVPRA